MAILLPLCILFILVLVLVLIFMLKPTIIVGFKTEVGNDSDGYHYFICHDIEQGRRFAKEHEYWNNTSSELASDTHKIKFNLDHPILFNIENGFVDLNMVYTRRTIKHEKKGESQI